MKDQASPTPTRKDIKITNVNHDVHSQLQNIADNMNVDVSQILKPHLHTIVAGYPDKLKIPKKMD